MSAPQADAQVTLSLPILRTGQHAGEPPVERLQFMLNFVAGVDNLDVDGIFGPQTEAAVRAFQQNENLRRRGRGPAGLDGVAAALAAVLAARLIEPSCRQLGRTPEEALPATPSTGAVGRVACTPSRLPAVLSPTRAR